MMVHVESEEKLTIFASTGRLPMPSKIKENGEYP